MPVAGGTGSMSEDTVFAVASGLGRAAIRVVRLSGSGTRSILKGLTGTIPRPRVASVRELRLPSGEPLDRGLVLFFPAPASYTGEDCAELHLHGGRATTAAVLAALTSFDRCRAAEPGEFTRRAFANGKMDLAEVEGLIDLIEAETEAQRRQALRQLAGDLGRLVETWRARLLSGLASVEAAIDFSDEADVPLEVAASVGELASTLAAEIAGVLDDQGRGERLREGYVVVIAGPPNVGKSSLLNALARRDAAIVSPEPGTTRDAIEVHLDLQGLPVTLVDTAGIRASADPVERAGMALSRAFIGKADLVLALRAKGSVQTLGRVEGQGDVLRVTSKADLPGEDVAGGLTDLAVSAVSGAGLEALISAVGARASAAMSGAVPALITRTRHRRALCEAASALTRLDTAGPIELIAEDLRHAAAALGLIGGRISVDDVLGAIFAEFCIGK
jgi:tRNA modification GTPase